MFAADVAERRNMEIKIFTALFLGFNSWKDIIERKISLWTVALAAMVGLGNLMWQDKFQVWVLAAVGIGIGLLAVSIATGGALGMGDCWVIAVLGLLLEPAEFLVTICAGLFLSALWAGFLLMVLKKNKKTEFPFLPFLFLGYLGGLCL